MKTALSLTLLALLAGCAAFGNSSILLDGSPPEHTPETVRLIEGGRRPLLLRGVDQHIFSPWQAISSAAKRSYVMRPGEHVLWAMSEPAVLYPFPVPLGYVHCYRFRFEFKPGLTYRLQEPQPKEALLIEHATGDIVARGDLLDSFYAGTRTCRWPNDEPGKPGQPEQDTCPQCAGP